LDGRARRGLTPRPCLKPRRLWRAFSFVAGVRAAAPVFHLSHPRSTTTNCLRCQDRTVDDRLSQAHHCGAGTLSLFCFPVLAGGYVGALGAAPSRIARKAVLLSGPMGGSSHFTVYRVFRQRARRERRGIMGSVEGCASALIEPKGLRADRLHIGGGGGFFFFSSGIGTRGRLSPEGRVAGGAAIQGAQSSAAPARLREGVALVEAFAAKRDTFCRWLSPPTAHRAGLTICRDPFVVQMASCWRGRFFHRGKHLWPNCPLCQQNIVQLALPRGQTTISDAPGCCSSKFCFR